MVQNASSLQDDYYAQAQKKPDAPSVDTTGKTPIKLKIKAKKVDQSESIEEGTSSSSGVSPEIQEETPRGARLVKREHPSTGLMHSVMRSNGLSKENIKD